MGLIPDDVEEKHGDWPWPFSLISRRRTAWRWGRPVLLAGTAELEDGAPKPINPAGTWQLSRFPGAPWWAWPALYVGISGRRGPDGKYRNWRAGPRWDNVWRSVQWPAYATRRYTGAAIEDTST